ncbi:sugar ABC transporter permease [Streptomyces sp. NPDC004542]|uniref:carbohydrate ABC transporter permease n=1 Tax=Streptomyces sp. NPDC004542 TaxID=3154281 RepID=UPI0033A9F539
MTTPTAGRGRPGGGRAALAFLSPLVLIYLVFFGYGFWFLIRTSFTRVSLSFTDAVSVGLDNYRLLWESDTFRHAVLNNLLFAAISIAAALTLAYFIAYAVSAGLRPKRLMYVLFLVPSLMPLSLVSTVFGSMLQERFGVLNETLRSVGLGSLASPWLTDPGLAFGVVAVLFCYLIGLPVMYYTADLSAVPTEVVEAGLLDGAGTFRIMRSIVYPMMTSTHITVVLSLLLGSFRSLEVVLFSTGGGPAGHTEIVGTFLYRFSTDPGPRTGFVASAAVVVLLIAFVISVVQMFLTRPRSGGRR